MKNRKKTTLKKGFTFVEIIITILIVSAIAAFIIPRYEMVVEKTRSTEAGKILLAVADAKERFRQETGRNTTNFNDLDITIPPTSNFNNLVLGTGTDADTPIPYEARISRANNEYRLYINPSGYFICENTIEQLNGPCKIMGYTAAYSDSIEEIPPEDETSDPPPTTQPTTAPITLPPCKKICIDPGEVL